MEEKIEKFINIFRGISEDVDEVISIKEKIDEKTQKILELQRKSRELESENNILLMALMLKMDKERLSRE